MTAIETIQDDSPTRLAAIIDGMDRVFGADAIAVAKRQFEAAEGEARTVWRRIVIALSDR